MKKMFYDRVSSYNRNSSIKIPRLVLLDLDNTLYDYEVSHAFAIEAMRQTWTGFGFNDFDPLYEQVRLKVKKILKNLSASHSRLLYAQKMLETMGQSHRVDQALKLEKAYWATFLKRTQISPYVLSWLQLLYRHSIPVVLVTDLTAQIQFKKIQAWGLISFFAAIVTSEETGYDKPHRLIFETACAKVNYKQGIIWMVGDSIKNDMVGAAQIQAITFWKRNGKPHENHPAITASFDSFSNLIGLIEQGQSGGILWNN